ncbi:histidine kinase [Leptolyngbya sp. BL0902]|uniref:TIR domain-containing protein n=1 Tax=Leptolyngbya sp. BL0902 TaxID=1115757 RepID=UPI0018E84AA5|nr:TIR domain-containing protein [Leptolyngbya sp. BL0902]QQE66057.1 histidine kinase [Leptolyngbya sp. BL0902]
MPLYDLFISYGRADSKAFAIDLHHRLTERGYRVWIDLDDIPFAVDYQVHIDKSIEQAHNVLFVLSPHAVNSPYCKAEIERGLHFHKRIIPLLHVEEIAYDTWKQRNPQGTAADWATYQREGRHSGIQNLHPGVAKLNWINCREGIDDPDLALDQLVNTLEDHRDYVATHTELLVSALAWNYNQRQPRYLLSGRRRETAEAWLRQAIEENPPFAQPTDLHCEYITESTKYADDQLTQVYLCYADEDSNLKESIRRQLDRVALVEAPVTGPSDQVRRLLRRAGFTVWDRKQDLASGDNLQETIRQGIEGADSMVFLLSPAAVCSSYCLEELNYALSLHKRVIPVLVQPLGQTTLPTTLSHLSVIDLHEIQAGAGAAGANVQTSCRQLVTLLSQDAVYFRDHKRLLVQALKWERQRHNPSVLLRGAERRYYDGWIKAARSRPLQTPLPIQTAFVAESLAQPDTQTLDVFLIADPEDLDFARRLQHTLQVQGKSTWFNPGSRGDARHGQADALAEDREALETAANVVVLLSPHLAQNVVGQAQIREAQALSKRLIGVSDQPLEAEIALALPDPTPVVAFHHHGGDFSSNFGDLYRVLESDADYIDQHTRLLMRAIEWEKAGRDDSLLLRRKALDQANDWLAQSATKTPAPNPQQIAYITASSQLPLRRVRRRTLSGSAIVVTLGIYLLRLMGALQPLELAAFDALIRRRPSEPQDSHLLLVMVDETSGNWLREGVKQGRYQPTLGTIPDEALREGLEVLLSHDPALVGLDFYRDFAATPALADLLRQQDQIFAICKASYEDSPGVEQPPELPPRRIGFNDFEIDPNAFVRRHYLKHEADPPGCDTENAFSLRLTQIYLGDRGVAYTNPFLPDGGIQDMAFGSVRVPQLWTGGIFNSHSAAYSPLRPDQLLGYQSMVNYRHYQGDPSQFAPQITYKDLLTGQFDPELVRGRIVLIGYKDLTDRNADSYNTPQGRLPGVVIHGQMISQLVSATLENRPLIHWWPLWGETLWMGLWAVMGGLVVRQLVRPTALAMGATVGVLLLVGLSYGLLVGIGLWLPLVPALGAGLGTALLVAYLNYRLRNP